MIENNGTTDTKSIKNRLRLNNQDYEMVLSLYSPQGSFFPINTAALESLVIEESNLNWYKKGFLILKNSEDILERRPNEFFNKNFNYKFRNDGRDLLLVNIKPIKDTAFTNEEVFPKELYELSYIFSIYDTEDMQGSSPKSKNIKLYFWEFDYQLFLETTTEWSTNEVLYDQHPEYRNLSSTLEDDQRKVYTGDALKGLIKYILNNRSNTPVFDSWDPGATKLFYSTANKNNGEFDFDYILKRHVGSSFNGGEAGDLPFLYRTRYSKEWNLTSYSAFFSLAVTNNKQAGPMQREQFILTSSIPTSVVIPSLKHTPPDSTGTRNINFGVLGNISNYQFVNMAAIDNTMLLKSSPCYHYDIKEGRFNIDFKDTNIESIKSYFQKNYVGKFNYNTSPEALFTLNKSKLESRAMSPCYSYVDTKIGRFADSRNQVLQSSLFLNECLSFSVLGSTYRQANVFIGLDRDTGSVDADFDEKILGQWFTIKVTHEFTQTSYSNSIVAVKPHSDRNIRIHDDQVV